MCLPIGLILLLGTRRTIAETPVQTGRFDLVEALASTLGMTALVYGIVHSGAIGWKATATTSTLAAAMLSLAVLIVNEARARQPIMPLRLLQFRYVYFIKRAWRSRLRLPVRPYPKPEVAG